MRFRIIIGGSILALSVVGLGAAGEALQSGLPVGKRMPSPLSAFNVTGTRAGHRF